jgi:subtilisin family serine protease
LQAIFFCLFLNSFANAQNLTKPSHEFSEWVKSVIEQELYSGEKNIINASKLDPLIQILFDNPKIIDSERVLKDFIAGESTTNVSVGLKKSPQVIKFKDLKDKGNRRKWKQIVKQEQDKILPNLSPNSVRIRRQFKYVFGFSAEVSLEGLQELIEDNNVVSINKPGILKAQTEQGISLINAADVRSAYNGSGVGIAILDTGIDYDHPSLGGPGFPNDKVVGGYNFGKGDNDTSDDPMDQNGHGTACAGIAAGISHISGDYIGGVAPGAKLFAVKIYSGSTDDDPAGVLVPALEWCIDNVDNGTVPIKIVNISSIWGMYDSSCDEEYPLVTAAVALAVNAKITIFAASGNNGYSDRIGWPACIDAIISVGAVHDSGSLVDQVTSYSNSASFLDLLAPSDLATTTKKGDRYSGFAGTSAASPYAAGAAACLQSAAMTRSRAYLHPSMVREKLISTGDPITDTKSPTYTTPRVNLGAAIWDGDTDGDTIPDDADNCPDIPNQEQGDDDVDGIGNVCDDCQNDPDNDIDVDGTCGDIDNCPYIFNPAQTDWNNDGLGDACDEKTHDKDGDGVDNRIDNCVKVINYYQLDADGDGIGDVCDDTPGCGGCGQPVCEQ